MTPVDLLGIRRDHDIDLFLPERWQTHRMPARGEYRHPHPARPCETPPVPGTATRNRHDTRWRYADAPTCPPAARGTPPPAPPFPASTRSAVRSIRCPAAESLQRLGAPHEKLHPRLLLQPLHLVAQRRLGDVENLRSARQPAGLVNGLDGAQVAKFYMHVRLMIFLRIMKLPHAREICEFRNRHKRIRKRHAPLRRSLSSSSRPVRWRPLSACTTRSGACAAQAGIRFRHLWRRRNHPAADP